MAGVRVNVNAEMTLRQTLTKKKPHLPPHLKPGSSSATHGQSPSCEPPPEL